MIVVGGITRLTESGLSMVDWRPLIGIVPPLNEVDWQQAFDAYKNFPQYQQTNSSMDLEAFKGIFYWEYGHRVLGRLIGIIFFVPFIILLALKKIEKPMVPKLVVGLILGGLQGLMGWYMVMSGLVDIPRVSHYRLAAHLMLALLILAYLTWLVLDLWGARRENVPVSFRNMVIVLAPVLFLQILYGAFVAGSRAGYGYNTFPLMNGELIPQIAWQLSPLWQNLFDNNAMLQFLHRWLGASVLIMTITLSVMSVRLNVAVSRVTFLLLFTVLVQFLLGVFTLLNVVPIGLASLHQAGACFVLTVMVYLFYIVVPVSAQAAKE
jgi:cytochrome c oxidase assembly protein subunit 15